MFQTTNQIISHNIAVLLLKTSAKAMNKSHSMHTQVPCFNTFDPWDIYPFRYNTTQINDKNKRQQNNYLPLHQTYLTLRDSTLGFVALRCDVALGCIVLHCVALCSLTYPYGSPTLHKHTHTHSDTPDYPVLSCIIPLHRQLLQLLWDESAWL